MQTKLAHILSLCIATFLLIVGIFCALFAYQEKCLLQAELVEAQQKTAQSTAPRANAPSPAQTMDSIPQSLELQRENAKLLAELVSEEEVNRLLDHAQQCYDTYKGLEQTNLGLGRGVHEIRTSQDLENYWKDYEFQRKRALDNYKAFADLIAKLDLSQFSNEEKDSLEKYMALRERWSQILFDMDVSIEEKANVGLQMWEINNTMRLVTRINQVVEDSLGDRYKQYKERFMKLHRLVFNRESFKGDSVYSIINGHKYLVIVPDDFTFPDDTTPDDE